MPNFYRSLFIATLALTLVTLCIVLVGYHLTHFKTPLLPVHDSAIAWQPSPEPKARNDGTAIYVLQQADHVEYVFELSKTNKYPFAAYIFDFFEASSPQRLRNLSRYSGLSFRIACTPEYILKLLFYTHDDDVTVPGDLTSYRTSTYFFSCTDSVTEVAIPFDKLTTPNWWLYLHNLELTDRGYSLKHVYGFAIANSARSQRTAPVKVQIKSADLVGQSFIPLYLSLLVAVVIWGLFARWGLKTYRALLIELVKDSVDRARPIAAYKKLSLSTHKDKEKDRILKYMATEYANTELKIEQAVTDLGVSRAKINEALKSELGLTFTAYLNKLRMSEAARLLLLAEANVSDIAYSLGYNNVTYFNKLFKKEYGCPPTAFKQLYQEEGAQPSQAPGIEPQ